MKRQYMKPAMQVVKLQHQHIICSSPDGYDSKPLDTYRDDGDEVIDEGDIF